MCSSDTRKPRPEPDGDTRCQDEHDDEQRLQRVCVIQTGVNDRETELSVSDVLLEYGEGLLGDGGSKREEGGSEGEDDREDGDAAVREGLTKLCTRTRG
jgi:hypothetical protein